MSQITTPPFDGTNPVSLAPSTRPVERFNPHQPATLAETGLAPKDLFPLVLRRLFQYGDQSGFEISRNLRLPFVMVEPVLSTMKINQLIAPRHSAPNNDFIYELLPKGAEQARLAMERSTYCGAAPVTVEEYEDSVLRQSIKSYHPNMQGIQQALGDLVLSRLLIAQIGQAVSSGKSMFLYGPTGNGKSNIARRLIRAIDPHVWIPRALSIGGDVIRIFDPTLHEEVARDENQSLSLENPIDERWVLIHRPFISVGGELTLDHLEATTNPITKIIEAPIHIKSNCGCLAIEDLGRQRVSITELLNRWIVPMGEGHDFVNLPTGRQIRLPFDQLLVFTTNLNPNELCDEAFMRRMPYKIEVFDPTETQFRQLFEMRRQQYGFEYQQGIVDYLIESFYKRQNRPFRFCHVDDLLDQARDFCVFHGVPLVLNRDVLEMALLNYFSGTH